MWKDITDSSVIVGSRLHVRTSSGETRTMSRQTMPAKKTDVESTYGPAMVSERGRESFRR
jgi:hypothetical protein